MNLGQCAESALKLLSAKARARFALNPAESLRSELGLKVERVATLTQSRDDGGACDGISFLQDGVVLYAPTPDSRRENFTLGHELGHWLVEQSDEVYDWLADQNDPNRMLETVCDHVAQRLLLPDEVIDRVLGAGPIRAHHVLDIFSASQASRPVCAIALAKRLPTLGAVVIIDRPTARVSHASVRPDNDGGWPTVFPWRDQRLPGGHPLLNTTPDVPMTRRISWSNRWGAEAEFYSDAFAEPTRKRVIAVLCDRDLWNSELLHVDPARDFDDRPTLDIYCCGRSTTVRGYPCPTCQQPFCRQCGLCRCERANQREQACNECFRSFQPHLLAGGLCEECRS